MHLKTRRNFVEFSSHQKKTNRNAEAFRGFMCNKLVDFYLKVFVKKYYSGNVATLKITKNFRMSTFVEISRISQKNEHQFRSTFSSVYRTFFYRHFFGIGVF